MTNFQPLESKCRSEQVAEQIMQMIENGQLREGDKLPSEPDFARQLGISRGVLREGLAQLKAQGVISRKPKDGTYILPVKTGESGIMETTLRTIKESSYRSVMEMRSAIEQKAAALVIQRATDEEIAELRDIVLRNKQVMEQDDLDYYFHYRLVELSENTIFMGIVDSYFEEIREIRDTNLNRSYHQTQVVREHLDIVDAIYRRDTASAMQAVERHMKKIWERWLQSNDERLEETKV